MKNELIDKLELKLIMIRDNGDYNRYEQATSVRAIIEAINDNATILTRNGVATDTELATFDYTTIKRCNCHSGFIGIYNQDSELIIMIFNDIDDINLNRLNGNNIKRLLAFTDALKKNGVDVDQFGKNINFNCPFCDNGYYTMRFGEDFDKKLKDNGLILSDDNLGHELLIFHKDCEQGAITQCANCGEYIYKNYGDSIEYNGDYYCQSCYWDLFCECADCGQVLDRDGDNTYWHEDNDCYYCRNCYGSHNENEYIEDHDYKPEPIFYGKSKHNLFFGFELEIETPNNKIEIARELLETFNGDDWFYLKHDGSLNYGFEIVSHPLSFDYLIEHKAFIEKMLNWLISQGATGHNNTTCGLHFHISRDAFENDEQLDNFLYLNEKHQKQLKVFSRRRNFDWSRFRLSDNEIKTFKNNKQKMAELIKDKAQDCDRYKSVNLENRHTIEIRYNRSTLKVNTFYACLELIYNQYLISKKRYKTIEKISFNELIKKGNYTELISYWEQRQEPKDMERE